MKINIKWGNQTKLLLCLTSKVWNIHKNLFKESLKVSSINIGRLSPLHCLFTSPSCWWTHSLYLSNPPSGNLLPIIPWFTCSQSDVYMMIHMVMWCESSKMGWSTQHRAPWWRGQFTFVAVCEAARACSTYLSMIPRYSRSAIVSFVSGDSAQWGFLDSSLNTQFAFHGLRVRPALGFIILLMPACPRFVLPGPA